MFDENESISSGLKKPHDESHNPSRNASGFPTNQSQSKPTRNNGNFHQRPTNYRNARSSGSSSLRMDFSKNLKSLGPRMEEKSKFRGRPMGRNQRSRGQKPKVENPELDRSKTKFSYNKLKELSLEQDSLRVAVDLANSHNGLDYLLGEDVFLKERPEWIILLSKVFSKVCECQFPENKIKVLNIIFESQFIDCTLDCLHKQSSGSDKEKSESFLSDIFVLLETIIDLLPTSSIEKLHVPIQQIFADISCIEQFENIQIDNSIKKNFLKLESRLRDMRDINEKMADSRKKYLDDGEPPEDFRTFELYPYEKEILFNKHAFLRRNKVDGGYKNVEHYLDVQFRLLREDLMIPLREGFAELIDKVSKEEQIKINYLRYFEHCAFGSITTAHGTISYNICFDVDRKLNHINWEYNQWFKYGSLVFLSFDNFSSFMVAKVAEKDNKTCQKYRIISVELVGHTEINSQDWHKKVTMVESTIFFQPYYHVMKALKQFNEENFPLSRYIVEVNTDIRIPGYLQLDSVLKIGGYSFNVLDDNAWPSAEKLALDEFQYDALKSALTREFAIIQGPPGTGKTFLGLKIIEALVNYKHSNNKLLPLSPKLVSPILVVCYTNHALDQFLEGILKFTKSVIRVGSMTKSEAVKQCELSQHRHLCFDSNLNSAFLTFKNQMKDIVNQIQTMEQNLTNIDSREGILQFNYLSSYMSDAHKSQLGSNEKLNQWLLINDFIIHGSNFTNDVHIQDQETEMPQKDNEVNESDTDDDEFRREFKLDQCVFKMKMDKTVPDKVHSVTVGYLSWLKQDIEFRCMELENEYSQNIKSNYYVWKRWQLESEFQVICSSIEIMGIQLGKMESSFKVKNTKDLSSELASLNIDQRWKLYGQWVGNLKAGLMNSMKTLEGKYRKQSEQLQEAKQLQDLNVLRNFGIVGITTTAAARNHLLLTCLKPSIIIVEEAAEVLEAHIVTALTNHCQHLILIGDHLQLRPNPTVYKLAKQYNLEISLFERMINNKLSFSTLGVQHRMRPEICELITPAIYHNLQNHPSVYKFDDVVGINKNLFFASHEIDEVKDNNIQSYRNPHEGDFMLALAEYLLLQGYSPGKITILTTYSGQLIDMKMKKKERTSLNEVRLATVDNYQGEESQIILLSLVRSNPEDKIGFLATSNRVCVALSRAKIGFYLIGNMKALESGSEIWKLIKNKLEEQSAIGSHLELKCAIHKNKTFVSEKRDFLKVAGGGCSIICDTQLNCGHKCVKLCHSSDLQHENYECTNICTKVCSQGHPCTYACYQCSKSCQPCPVPMNNFVLTCSHVKDIQCSQIETYPCEEMIETNIELCGHNALVTCWSITKGDIKCPKQCDTRLSCGHQCTLNCHVDLDPDHIEFKCQKACEKFNTGCSLKEHRCNKKCSEPCPVCNEMVLKTLACGHQQNSLCHLDAMECNQWCNKMMSCGHPCKKKCKDICGGCEVIVDKEIQECKHVVKMKCKTIPILKFCQNSCQKKLSCGHLCSKKCNETCTTTDECLVLVDHSSLQSPCSHGMARIPCKYMKEPRDKLEELALKHCTEPCGEILLCNHTCTGTCGECQQKRFHKICYKKCERVHICGHGCKQECSTVCLPCKARCSAKCRHQRCNRSCHEPCPPCYDECSWKCEHEVCSSRNCSDICRRKRCYKSCQVKLECGHECIGFCGEPCPDKCRVCDEDEVKMECLTCEYSDARFVVLEDCGHFFESNKIENYLSLRSNTKNMDTEIIVKTCPKCKTPIVSTLRFANSIRYIKRNLEAAKRHQQKIQQERSVSEQKLDLICRLQRLNDFAVTLPDTKLGTIRQNILNQIGDITLRKSKGTKKITSFVTVDQMRLFSFLTHCLECLELGFSQTNRNAKEILKSQLNTILLNMINIPNNKISQQLKFDFFCEIDKFYALVNLLSLKANYQNFEHFQNKSSLTTKYIHYTEEIGHLNKFDRTFSKHFDILLKNMEHEISSNIPFGMRFDQIELIKPDPALWQDVYETNIRVYMCFRSHLYHVTETEVGAVEESACPECARRETKPQTREPNAKQYQMFQPNNSYDKRYNDYFSSHNTGPYQQQRNQRYEQNRGFKPFRGPYQRKEIGRPF